MGTWKFNCLAIHFFMSLAKDRNTLATANRSSSEKGSFLAVFALHWVFLRESEEIPVRESSPNMPLTLYHQREVWAAAERLKPYFKHNFWAWLCCCGSFIFLAILAEWFFGCFSCVLVVDSPLWSRFEYTQMTYTLIYDGILLNDNGTLVSFTCAVCFAHFGPPIH